MALKLTRMPSMASAVASTDEITATSSSTTEKFQIEGFNQAQIEIDVTAATGTSPTLDIVVQTLLPDGTTWHAIGAASQITDTGKVVISAVSGGNLVEDQSLTSTAGTMKAVPFGAWWRFSYTIGGTNPSFTFTIYVRGLS